MSSEAPAGDNTLAEVRRRRLERFTAGRSLSPSASQAPALMPATPPRQHTAGPQQPYVQTELAARGRQEEKRSRQAIAAAPTDAVVAAPPAGAAAPAAVVDDDDDVPAEFECVLCMRLYFEPVSLPCGHTYCRGCLRRALHSTARCPVCRAATAPEAAAAAANLTIVSFIKRGHGPQYAARSLEAVEDEAHEAELKRRALAVGDDTSVGPDGSVVMPVFFLDIVVFPQQPSTLFVFEPRYIVMVDRCLSGSRRFVMTGNRGAGAVGSILQIEDARVLAARQYLLQCRSVGRCVISTPPEPEPDTHNLHYAQVTPFEDDDDVAGSGGVAAAQETLGEELMDAVDRAAEVVYMSIQALPPSAKQELRRRYGDAPSEPRRTLARYRKLSFWLPAALALPGGAGGSRRRAALLAERSMRRRLQQAVDIIDASDAASAPTARRRELGARRLFELSGGRGAAFLNTACSSIALLAAIFVGLMLWTGGNGMGGSGSSEGGRLPRMTGL